MAPLRPPPPCRSTTPARAAWGDAAGGCAGWNEEGELDLERPNKMRTVGTGHARECWKECALTGGLVMAKPLVSDALWERFEPLLPRPKPRRVRYPGRRPLDRRKVLTGIVFILKTGIAWEDLPTECGWGCGITCKRYLRRW